MGGFDNFGKKKEIIPKHIQERLNKQKAAGLLGSTQKTEETDNKTGEHTKTDPFIPDPDRKHEPLTSGGKRRNKSRKTKRKSKKARKTRRRRAKK